jgi:hypothetical protein
MVCLRSGTEGVREGNDRRIMEWSLRFGLGLTG